MSQKLLNTLPFFTDQNGKALDLGQVFVGVESQDPQQNPVAVYWDEAKTVPAAQPLRTANGYIYRNGAASSVFISGDDGYSLRVLDRNGRVLRNELSANRLKSSEVTYDGGTVRDKLRRTAVNPQDYGCPVDGVSDASAYFSEMFDGGNKTVHITGASRFVISQPIYLEANTIVYCDPQTEIYLANMARCFMFRTAPGAGGTIKWFGGVINGNDANQGDQTLDGTTFDKTKGFYMLGVDFLEIAYVTLRNLRGHGINHWNCDVVYIHDIECDQTIDVVTPVGGKRRDGVTGSSNYVTIERVKGYTNDDMVAVLAGVDWAGPGTFPQTVKKVTVRDIDGGAKSGQKTWRAVRILSLDGYRMEDVLVENVTGECANRQIEVGSYDPYGKGDFGKVTINTASGVFPNSSVYANNSPIFVYNADIEKLTINDTDYTVPPAIDASAVSAIFTDKADILEMFVNGATLTDKRATDSLVSTVLVRNNSIRDLCIVGASVESQNFPTSVNTFILIRRQVGGSGTGDVNLRGDSWRTGLAGTNLLKWNVRKESGDLTCFTFAAIVGITESKEVGGACLTDLQCGQVQVNDDLQWRQVSIPKRAYSRGFPTTGFWRTGFQFVPTGAPRNAVAFYTTVSGTAPFDWKGTPSGVIGAGVADDFSAAPSTYAPSVDTIVEVGAANAASFPEGLPGVLTTRLSNASDTTFVWASQEYKIRGTNKVYSRFWQTGSSTWSAFVKISAV